MKNIFAIILIISVLMPLSGGCKKKNMNDLITNESINNSDSSEIIYTDKQLEEIKLFDGNISELYSKYPTHCLQKKDTNYQVAFWGETKILIDIFDDDGQKISCNIYNISNESQSFDSLSVGDSIEKVKQTDSLGCYIFLYTGRNDIPHVSTHYTKDGYIIQITYDENNCILSISKNLI